MEQSIDANGKTLMPMSASTECAGCGEPMHASLRNCPGCNADWGFPNVRAASLPAEATALSERLSSARNEASARGISAELSELVKSLEKDSFVIVAMPTLNARIFLSDPKQIYSNYETLVGAGARVPAAPEADLKRYAVGGKLFGGYSKRIMYGVLALTDAGLSNYGKVFLHLRDVAVKSRVSFLNENSYTFVETHNVATGGTAPLGYKSTWSTRSHLAAAKLEPKLNQGSNQSDWASILVEPKPDRNEDEFIEAHVYGGFNARSIHSVSFANSEASRQDRLDFRAIQECFANVGVDGGDE